MALDDVVSQFNASVLLASEWANLALSPSTSQDLRLKAIGAAQANINLSVATQIKLDIESLLIESEAQLSTATNNGESVSTLDILRSQLDSTRKADQKALVELTAAKANVDLALKSVEALLSTAGEDPELPQDLNDAIESVSAATLSIQASARDASADPSQATQSAEQINGSIQKLDEARNDLDKARVDLLAAMQSMGAPTSPGLSALVELQIAIGSLIEESQLTLSTSQTGEQATHSFSQLEKFAEALQQLAAQVESAVEQDDILKASLLLKNEISSMPESLRTINGVGLSTFADNYIIISGSSTSIPITVNGQPASKTNPGFGWQAVAVAPSKSGSQYELIWKNSNTGQFASWKLDPNGALIKGDALSQTGLLELEDNLGADLNDDNATGWNFQTGKQIQGLTLLTAQAGSAYAIQKSDGSKVTVTYNNGQIASKDNPGFGWQAVAVAPSENGDYHLYWENKSNPSSTLARWEVSASGSYREGKALSESEFNLDELNIKKDLNDDQRIGPFQKVEGTITQDILTANPDNPFQVLYGRQGKDQLTSGSQNSLGFDILIGGSGDDSYFVPNGTSALITEQGGNDPLDELIAKSVNTSRSKFATLEGGRHLGIFDQTTNTSLFIYDWQQESNRIEVFTMQDRAYTFDQFKQAVIPTGQVVPDLTWGQWDQQFGIGHISHIGLAQGVTLAKLAETYSSI